MAGKHAEAMARAVRTLDAKAVELLRWSAAHHIENGNRFLADVKPV